jgi:hypothetical protein
MKERLQTQAMQVAADNCIANKMAEQKHTEQNTHA